MFPKNDLQLYLHISKFNTFANYGNKLNSIQFLFVMLLISLKKKQKSKQIGI